MGNSKKQTAVEWLINQLERHHYSFGGFKEEIEQAKEIEKQQIIDAYDLGMGHYGGANRRSDAEQYYNETFNKKLWKLN